MFGESQLSDNLNTDFAFVFPSLELQAISFPILENVGNVINGTDGNDDLIGTADADDIFGFGGDDTLQGLDGDDFLNGGTGNDTIDGGEGNDTVSYLDSFGLPLPTSLPGGSDGDGSGADAAGSGAGSEEATGQPLNMMLGGFNLVVDLSTGKAFRELTNVLSATALEADILISIENVIGTDFADMITGDDGDNILFGQFGDDVINGGDGDDIIDGGFVDPSFADSETGNDIINGGAGDDTIIFSRSDTGNTDIDTVDGGDGIDTFVMSVITDFRSIDLDAGVYSFSFADDFGGATRGFLSNIENVEARGAVNVRGDDMDNVITISGPAGDNILEGLGGNDTIFADLGNDNVDGGAGDDMLDGGEGNDVLIGGSGNDTLIGGDGDDLLFGGGGQDMIDGGAGIDTNSFAGIGLGVTATVAADGSGTASYGMVNEVFAGIENLTGSDNDDSLSATGMADNILDGGDGDDALDGGEGNDDLLGGTGDDALNGGAGIDFLRGGIGDDVLIGGDGDDVLIGGTASEGTLGGVSLGSGLVTRAMGAGNSSIATAIDVSDEFSFADNPNIANATTIPHVTVSGVGEGDVHFYAINIDTPGAVITFDIDFATGGSGSFDSWLELYDSDGNFLALDDDSSTLDGAGGSTSTLDSFLTFVTPTAGVYFIAVGSWPSLGDIPVGGDYELQISVDTGAIVDQDLMGDDVLNGGAGADVLDGGAGNDTADYMGATSGVTADLLGLVAHTSDAVGDTFNSIENLSGSEFADRLFGDGGDNSLMGGSGNDQLFGRFGDDTLSGGDGRDNLVAGLGDDTLYGGSGNDRLLGNAGDDVFVFGDDHGSDRIDDFVQGEDLIEFTNDLIDFASLTIEQDGANVVITSAEGTITVLGSDVADFTEDDFIFADMMA